jgi:predicted  nucleic acid-binding Zn-ribbon protein
MDEQTINTLRRDIKLLQDKTDKQQKEIEDLKKQIQYLQAK